MRFRYERQCEGRDGVSAGTCSIEVDGPITDPSDVLFVLSMLQQFVDMDQRSAQETLAARNAEAAEGESER